MRAEHWAMHLDTIDCRAGETTRIVVQLRRGTTVSGTVRDERGLPIAGAQIRTLSPQFAGTDAMLASSAGDRGAVARPRTRSDEAGHFVLHNLPAGDVHLLATMRTSPTILPANRTTLACTGGTMRWDPVLTIGLSIRVRLVDAHGHPMLGHVMVHAEDANIEAEPRYSVIPERDEFHTYTIAGCADADYSVTASVDRDDRRHCTSQNGVRPGGPVVVLQVPAEPAALPPGTVRGRVVDAGQRLRGKPPRVRLYTLMTGRDLELRDDRFHSDAMPPGNYCIVVQTARDTVFVGPWFELHPAEELDLGELITAAGAELFITLRSPDGADISGVNAWLGEGFDSQPLHWDGHSLQCDNVTPGRRELQLSAEHWFAAPRTIDIAAGRRNEFIIDVLPAAPCNIRLELPLPGKWQRIDLRVRDARGEVINTMELTMDNPMWSLHWPGSLPFGQFEYEAIVDGVRHAWPLDLRNPATRDQPLRFSLR